MFFGQPKGLFGRGAPGGVDMSRMLEELAMRERAGYGTPGIGGGMNGGAPPMALPGMGGGDPRLSGAPRMDFAQDVRNSVADNAMRGAAAGPDYAGHYAMHGHGPDGPRSKKRGTGEKILGAIGDMALMMVAPPLAGMKWRRDGERRQAKAEEANHNRIVNAMMRKGMSADDAELAAINAQKFGEELVTKYRTRDMAPGHTTYTPELDGSSSRYTAPQILQQGADAVVVDQNGPQMGGGMGAGGPPATAPRLFGGGANGLSPPDLSAAPRRNGAPGPSIYETFTNPIMGRSIMGLRTDAEQAAQAAGYMPGTPEYLRFVRDYTLKGQGPTAVGLDRERMGVTMRGQDISQGNSVRTAETARTNRADTPAATTINGRGETVLVYPDNRVTTLRGSRDPRNQRGRGRLGQQSGRGGSAPAPEGTIIAGPNGQKQIKRNGRWVPYR